MTFREQAEALTSTCTGDMVPAMRQILVFLARRIEAAQPAAPTVEELQDALVDEGYPPELPMQLLRAVLQEADGLDPQWTQSYEERMGEPGQTLATLSSDLKHEQPTLHQQIGDLIEAAIKEDEELSGVSGGKGSSSGFMAKTWTRTPNATKKQKWEKRGLDVAEAFVGLAVLNRIWFRANEHTMAKQVLSSSGNYESKPWGATFEIRHDNIFGNRGELKATKGLILDSMSYKFSTWGDRLSFETYRWVPFRAMLWTNRAKKQINKLNKLAGDIGPELELTNSTTNRDSGPSNRESGPLQEIETERDITDNEVQRARVEERRHSSLIDSELEKLEDIPEQRPQRRHSQVIPENDKLLPLEDVKSFLSATEFANSAERLGSFTSKAERELNQAAKAAERNIERDVDEAIDKAESTFRGIEDEVESMEDGIEEL